MHLKIQKVCSALIASLLLVAGGVTVQAHAEEAENTIRITEVRQTLAESEDIDGLHQNADESVSYLLSGAKTTGMFSVNPDYVMADLNGDDVANASDATIILQAAAASATGKKTASEIIAAGSAVIKDSTQALKIGDINYDKNINSEDATEILVYSAKSGVGAAVKPLGYAVYFADENGNLQKGWIENDGETYYASDNYQLVDGFQNLDGKRVYFENYTLVTGTLKLINGKTYYLDTDGTILTNIWLDLDGSMHYFNDKGEMLTGIQIINDKLYAFDEDGSVASGWFRQNDATFYALENGLLATGLQTIEEQPYCFGDNGLLLTGWIKREDGTRYANADGVLVTGDQEIDGQNYHFEENGLLRVSGWVTEGQRKRYILEDGTYLKGVQKIGENFYAFDNDGYVLTGWCMSGGKYRYAKADGVICMGLYKFDDKTVYFDTVDGAMQTGWQTINGSRYYFDENGIMVTGTQVIDGTTYEFGADGKYVKRNIKICVDPGHYTNYNHSPVNSAYYEGNFTWQYHLILVDALKAHGMDVITTRYSSDSNPDLEVRGRMSEGCDLFLSVHSNATGNGNTTIDGPMACCNVDGSTDVLGLQLADTVAQVMGTNDPGTIWKRHYPDRYGVDYYGVLRGAKSVGTPGILLEHSYHTNYRATVWLMDTSNLIRMADAEAVTIARYYGLE